MVYMCVQLVCVCLFVLPVCTGVCVHVDSDNEITKWQGEGVSQVLGVCVVCVVCISIIEYIAQVMGCM